MSTLFKRIVVLSILASVSCYYVNAVGVSARPAPVVRSAPTIRSTPIKSTPVNSTPSKSNSNSNSVKTTKSTTSENETRSVTNNYYYNNGGLFNSVMGAFTGTWLYHSLFDDNDKKETDTEDTNSDNSDNSSVEDETFSISYWIANNLEYIKNLLFGIK